jgi:hypothetical protein
MHVDDRITITGTTLVAGEQFPPDPPADPDCRSCNFPWDDGAYCRRCGAMIRQPDEDVLEPKLTDWDRRVLAAVAPWPGWQELNHAERSSTWQVAERVREEDVKYVRETLAGLERCWLVVSNGARQTHKLRWVQADRAQEVTDNAS